MEAMQGLYIGGEWVRPSNGWTDVVNPATGAAIAKAPVGDQALVRDAIGAAHVAFHQGPWPRLPIRERVARLETMRAWLEQQARRIIEMIVAEAGATQMLAQWLQFAVPMKHVRYALEEALTIRPEGTPPEVSPSLDGRLVLGGAVTHFDPVGVVAAITPYNFPFFLNIVKVFPALAMGNTLVLKPSPFTPLQALILGEAAQAAGLPKGVLNVVTGDVAAGELLTADPRIDLVSFTGSDLVGAKIMAQGASTLKRMLMELGGKSAMIVRADADLDAAAQAGVASYTIHSGQGCALTTRHLVHNSVRPAYVERLRSMTTQLKIGDPADPSVMIGPLIRESARARVESYVQAGLDAGARLVVGGKRPDGLDRGFFFEPTVFDGVDNGSRIAQEEIFGPVACVIGFERDEEAVEIANGSPFGLSGAIFSADTGRAYEMAMGIRTGSVGINGGAGTMLSMAPFGGIKRSGFGRECGRHGLLEFTFAKSISFHAG